MPNYSTCCPDSLKNIPVPSTHTLYNHKLQYYLNTSDNSPNIQQICRSTTTPCIDSNGTYSSTHWDTNGQKPANAWDACIYNQATSSNYNNSNHFRKSGFDYDGCNNNFTLDSLREYNTITSKADCCTNDLKNKPPPPTHYLAGKKVSNRFSNNNLYLQYICKDPNTTCTNKNNYKSANAWDACLYNKSLKYYNNNSLKYWYRYKFIPNNCNNSSITNYLNTLHNTIQSTLTTKQEKLDTCQEEFNNLNNQHIHTTNNYNTCQEEFNNLNNQHINTTNNYNNCTSEYNYYQPKYNTCQTEFNNLNNQHINTTNNYNSCQEEYNNLNNQPINTTNNYNSCQEEYNNLNNQYINTTNNYNSCQEEYNNLNNQYINTINNYNSCQEEYNNLNNQPINTTNNYNNCASEYNYYQPKYNTCQEEYNNMIDKYDKYQDEYSNLYSQIQRVKITNDDTQLSIDNLPKPHTFIACPTSLQSQQLSSNDSLFNKKVQAKYDNNDKFTELNICNLINKSNCDAYKDIGNGWDKGYINANPYYQCILDKNVETFQDKFVSNNCKYIFITIIIIIIIILEYFKL
jgi:predicted nuclease with TOPRIM domain